jgi:hypothetical protein
MSIRAKVALLIVLSVVVPLTLSTAFWIARLAGQPGRGHQLPEVIRIMTPSA